MANEYIADGIYRVSGLETTLKNGAWVSDAGTYLVTGQAKLASIPGAQPGDVAFTAGYTQIWQLNTDGTTWVELPKTAATTAATAAAASATEAAESAATATAVLNSIPQDYTSLTNDVVDLKSALADHETEYLAFSKRVLNDVVVTNDFVYGRYLSGGFSDSTSYARNRIAYPAGKYEVGPYAAKGYVAFEYNTDATGGTALIQNWSVSKETFVANAPWYLTFNTITGDADIAAINAGMIVKRISTDGSSISDRIAECPEMYGAKGDGTTDDTDALNAMFASAHGRYCMENTYAISSPVSVHGYIYGGGTIKVRNSDESRLAALFNVAGDTVIDGMNFDCESGVEFVESDYGSSYNVAIRSESNSYDLEVRNCGFVNGYNTFIYCHSLAGKINIRDSQFVADGTLNMWTGYMIFLLTISGTDAINISGNKFIGNGDSTENFAGIFLSGITTRKDINIYSNTFDGVGRNKTGGHQSHCVDCYWNVSHLRLYDNVMTNNTYCCLRIHGGTDYNVYDNYFGNAANRVTDAAILVQDDHASTGATRIGVSNVRIHNNVFANSNDDNAYEAAIQLTSANSSNAGSITNVSIMGNHIDRAYKQGIVLDGSAATIEIVYNSMIATLGIRLANTMAFQSNKKLDISNNNINAIGGTAIASDQSVGNPNMYLMRNVIEAYTYAVNFAEKTNYNYIFDNTIIAAKGIKNANVAGGNLMVISSAQDALDNVTTSYCNIINGAMQS